MQAGNVTGLIMADCSSCSSANRNSLPSLKKILPQLLGAVKG